MISLRRLGPDDWALWRSVRLQALRESPAAFGARLSDWSGAGDREERWRARLHTVAFNVVAEIDGAPAGQISGSLVDGREVEVLSTYVTPSARGRGVGEALIEAVVGWATSDPSVDRIGLDVHEGNGPAQGLYGRCGFSFTAPPSGRPDAERRMTRRLAPRVRVGVHSGQQYADPAVMQDLWSSAEALGYDWLSLFDHQRPPIAGPDGGLCLDGPTMLSALAATTPRVRCGLLVTTPTWRHPALTAAVAATLDRVSGGRLELGVGVGGSDLAFAQYGIQQPPLATRYEQLDETCRVLRLLWEGGPADFVGKHYRLAAAHLAPGPVQRRLPLTVGGSGRLRTLPVVARHADVWNSPLLAFERYAGAAARLDDLCRAEGRDPADVRRSMTFRCALTDRPDAARAAVAERGHAADLPEFVSFGSAQECLDRLAPYVDIGVRDFLLGIRPPVGTTDVERFAAEVVPGLRALVTA